MVSTAYWRILQYVSRIAAHSAAFRRPMLGFREQGQMRMAERRLMVHEAVCNRFSSVVLELRPRSWGLDADARSWSDCMAMPAQSTLLAMSSWALRVAFAAQALISLSSWSVVEVTEEAFVDGERVSGELESVLGLRVSIRDEDDEESDRTEVVGFFLARYGMAVGCFGRDCCAAGNSMSATVLHCSAPSRDSAESGSVILFCCLVTLFASSGDLFCPIPLIVGCGRPFLMAGL